MQPVQPVQPVLRFVRPAHTGDYTFFTGTAPQTMASGTCPDLKDSLLCCFVRLSLQAASPYRKETEESEDLVGPDTRHLVAEFLDAFHLSVCT